MDRPFFLDVRQSASGLAWQSRLDPRQENVALAIAQAHGIPDIVARVLAARNIELDAARAFLNPTVRDLLPDPMSLTDMDRAARRLAQAVLRRERVAIFGDYDVDGAASSAALARFLRHFGLTCEIYIPDRIFEGYGPNPDAMPRTGRTRREPDRDSRLRHQQRPSIAAARAAGADVVVLDHHQVGGPLPEGVPVVNPNREDDLSGQGHLCAAGVVFLALVATTAELRRTTGSPAPPDLLGYLDLVALATVCDVVPLRGVNRAFVVKGLLAARQMKSPGIAALSRVARIGEPLAPYHLSFIIGPRNQRGRSYRRCGAGRAAAGDRGPDRGQRDRRTTRRSECRAPGDGKGHARRGPSRGRKLNCRAGRDRLFW
jgi:single-stranded-DNA-specific exonuclease